MKKLFFLVFVIVLLPFFASAETNIDAKVYRNQAGSGDCLVSGGFPLPQGLVTEQLVRDGKIKVFVNGGEVAANVSALRGRHPDGSVRSILIQFTYSLSQGDVLSAQVIIDGGVRSNPDPNYQRPTLEMITNNNVILPSDPAYITSTHITLRGLIPAGGGLANEERFYTEMASDRFNVLASKSFSESSGMASYEDVSAILSLWARSGDVKYQKQALANTLSELPYNTPSNPAWADSNKTVPCKCESVTNPDGRTGGQVCGLPSEVWFSRMFGYAQMYLMTGYRDFWGIVAYEAQYQQNDITDQAAAFSKIMRYQEFDNPRFNYANKYGALIAAMMIDAAIPVDGAYFGGRVFNWENQFKWTIDALEHWKWDFKWIPFTDGSGTVPVSGTVVSQGGVSATLLGVYQEMHDQMNFAGNAMPASGYLMVENISGGSFTEGTLKNISATAIGTELDDYRYGLIAGARENSPRGLSRPPENPVSIPTFQLVFPTNFLIDTYLYVYPDPRIPAMVKKNLDVILMQIFPKESGQPYYSWSGGVWGDHQFVKSYKLENPVSRKNLSDSSDPNPFELPEYARMIAFVLKTNGDDTVNGATYTQWYQRCVDTANVSPFLFGWAWKYFGQFYGWGQDAPWMMQQDSLLNNGNPTFHAPTQYMSIPGDVPDVYRNNNIPQGRVYTIDDFITIISNWMKSGTVSDINIDGIANARDLGIMMSNWQ